MYEVKAMMTENGRGLQDLNTNERSAIDPEGRKLTIVSDINESTVAEELKSVADVMSGDSELEQWRITIGVCKITNELDRYLILAS